MRQLAAVLLLLAPATAPAAARKAYVSSFDRIRVEGPFRVTVTVGGSPGGTVSGDARAVDGVIVRQDGATVVVRAAPGADRAGPAHDDQPPLSITLSTPSLIAGTVVGGGALGIVGGRADRLDLAVTGDGSLTLSGATAEQVNATVIGNGAMVLAGHTRRARLLINGAGGIAADQLDTGELVVRVDGPGQTTARARYTASVGNTGLGHVTVAGTPKCDVRGGGAVTCGTGAARRPPSPLNASERP